MNNTISIHDWHQMASKGDVAPARILLNGNSMFPLVRKNRDYVKIFAIDSELQIGDIVLFHDSKSERFVVHRIWNIKEDMVLTWGDNCSYPDAWISKDSVWGKVKLVERGRRKIVPDPKKGLRWAKFWHRAGKVYRYFGRCWHKIVDRK